MSRSDINETQKKLVIDFTCMCIVLVLFKTLSRLSINYTVKFNFQFKYIIVSKNITFDMF